MSNLWPTMFSTYNDPSLCVSVSGDTVRAEYVLSVGQDGRKCLSKVRDVDISAYINSFAPGCDMAVILNKLNAGLISTLYDDSNCVDLSVLPKDVVDAMMSMRQLKSDFANLPADMQKIFNFDSALFVQSMIDGSFEHLVKPADPKSADPKPADPKPADPESADPKEVN